MTTDRVYRRDVSWHASGRGGSAFAWHWPSPTDPGMARCQPSRIMLLDTMPGGEVDRDASRDPARVLRRLRCTGSGCRQQWEKWDADHTPVPIPGPGTTDVSGQGGPAPAEATTRGDA